MKLLIWPAVSAGSTTMSATTPDRGFSLTRRVPTVASGVRAGVPRTRTRAVPEKSGSVPRSANSRNESSTAARRAARRKRARDVCCRYRASSAIATPAAAENPGSVPTSANSVTSRPQPVCRARCTGDPEDGPAKLRAPRCYAWLKKPPRSRSFALLGAHLDVAGGQQEHLVRDALHAAVQA